MNFLLIEPLLSRRYEESQATKQSNQNLSWVLSQIKRVMTGGILLLPVHFPLQAASLQARTARHYAHALPADAPLLEKLKGTLQKRLQIDFDQPLRLELTSHTSNSFKTPVRLKNFQVKSVQFDPHHKGFTSEVLFFDEQQQEYVTPISGRVIFLKRVPIFKETLAPGEIISLEKVNWQVLEDDYRLRHVITDPEKLKGALVKALIRPGDMPSLKTVHTHQTQAAHIVEKGAPVEVVYKEGSLSITLSGGRALAKGHVGERIPVSYSITRSKRMDRSERTAFGVVESGHRVRISTSG